MITLNKVVLSVIACLENEAVRNEIAKNYELKIEKLKHYDDYVNSEDFKTKIINDINFNSCVSYAIKQLNDEKFRIFTQRSNICLVAFYKKEVREQNLFDKNANGTNIMSSLSSIIVRYYIEDETLYICVNPVRLFKERILSNKEAILKHFNDNNKPVNNLEVKFIHNDTVLDDLSETFLDLGYTIK